METLRPVEISKYYINRISKGMQDYFWDNIFKEIFTILENPVDNSKDDLIKAIKQGTIWYEDGAFKTKNRFSNQVALELEKLGAKYYRGTYKIAKNMLPLEITNAISFVNVQSATIGARISDFLTSLNTFIYQAKLNRYIEPIVDLTFKKLQLDVLKSAQEKRVPVIELDIVQPKLNIPKAKLKQYDDFWKKRDKRAKELSNLIKIAQKSGKDTTKLRKYYENFVKESYLKLPKYDFKLNEVVLDAQSKKIAEDYVYNMQYWVKKWEAKNIIKMRQDVTEMVQQGARVPRIREYFEKRWKIAKDKANFLAENESNLVGSVIKANNYQDLGCNSFIWGRSSSKEKRLLHKEYYGEEFRFDEPPIIDEKLGIKGLPRQIWNCKCHMLVKPPTLTEIISNTEEIRNAKRNIFTRLHYKIKNSKQCSNNAWRYRRFGEGT